jgi:L-cysteine desulfidase
MNLKEFLAAEVRPALGCTEPVAVALAVARAAEELPDRDLVASVRVTAGAGIYKNGMAVGIPGTKGARGNAVAAALGAIRGRSSYCLEVLRDCSEEDVERAKRWVQEDRVSVHCDPDRLGVYVLATVFTPGHKAVALVEGRHDRIARVLADGREVFAAPELESAAEAADLPASLEETLALAETLDAEDEGFLLEGVALNRALADCGLSGAAGSGLGREIREMIDAGDLCDDLFGRVRAACAAASDARMGGALLPAMSSAGSGNHGITAILPVAMAGEALGRSRREIARGLAISHLATSFVKRRLGRLSPVCGCAVAAGAGASAGVVSLMGGTGTEIARAMKMILGTLAGMLCDGAKESCSLKVGAAGYEAMLAARTALDGRGIDLPQGVIGATLEETVDNVARVSREGMKTADRVVIDILDARHGPEGR